MTANELATRYLSVLRQTHGDEIADESTAWYDRGWYYIGKARRFPDGSIGTGGETPAYRSKDVLKMIEVMKTLR